ncbi:MAG: DMT family transporter [Chloroflexota bacterium]
MGMLWGVLVALAYAAMNLCLRAAALQVDPLVATLVRGIPMLLFAWGTLAAQCQAGQIARIGWRVVVPLIGVAVLLSVMGNGGFQSGLTYAGLTTTVPVTNGALLWGSAVAGWWLMREPVTSRSIVGLLLLAAAVPLLVSGGGGGIGPVWVGALAATVAGVSYGFGNALLRQTVKINQLAQPPAVAVVSTAGTAATLIIVLARQGTGALAALNNSDLAWLLVAGVFNAVAFVALAGALALLPTARVGALGTLQTAISAIGGVVIFSEPLTGSIVLGLAVSVIGAILSQRAPAERATVAKTPGTRA